MDRRWREADQRYRERVERIDLIERIVAAILAVILAVAVGICAFV